MSDALVVNGRFLQGPQTGLQRTARSLLDALRERGLDVQVVAPAGVGDPRVSRTTWSPPGRLGQHVWEQGVLPAIAGGRRLLSLANTGPVLARRGVVMVHDLAPLVGPQWFARPMRLYVEIALAAARRAERVLTVSDQVAGELDDAGVRSDLIRIVRPAIDPSFQRASPDAVNEVRRRFDLGRPYLLLVGWADPRKDAATAVEAHRRSLGHVPHLLVLVGRAHPAFRPVRLPYVPSVRQLDYVTDEQLRALLTGAAALVYPSRYEGFGLPPLEAWACGTPALVSDLPAIRESTRGGAVYLPPGDVDRWAAAMAAALADGVPVPEPSGWGWEDAARQLVDALPA